MVSLALYSWPLVTLAIFGALGPARGLIWATVVGYLFLPEMTIRPLPLLPDYGKENVISYSLLLAMLIFASRFDGTVPPLSKAGRAVIGLCFLAIIGGSVMTVLDNGNALRNGDKIRQGLDPRDIGNMITTTLIPLTPYLLALRYLASREMQREVLVAMVIMASIYSVLVLYEWRMSPQINLMIYDFFPHDWRQHIRGGGFRPLVFLRHGLWLGFFLLSACLAAAALWRASPSDKKLLPMLALIWLVVVLFLSRNLGATVILVLFFAMMMLTTKRFQVRIAMMCAVIFLSYPALRQADLIPVDAMVDAAESLSERRAASLEYRFVHEKEILDRALEKPVFGWGGWARWRVVNDKGEDVTTSDGIWVIKLGEGGWVGYLGFFGLLAMPLILIGRRLAGTVPPETVGLAMIMGANFLYAVPNSTLSPIGYLVAGTLAAQAFRVALEAGAQDTALADRKTPLRPAQPRYTRFGDQKEAATPAAPPRAPEGFARTRPQTAPRLSRATSRS